MKIFISWSGELSRDVACVFREWIPNVIQSVDPFVSCEEMEKGSRWGTEIAKELSGAGYGIIIVTKDNLNAPWINFEAGALSKSFDSAHVAPFLLNLKPADLPQGHPLIQFQATEYTKNEILKLLTSINNNMNNMAEKKAIDPERLNSAFEKWWPDLETKLNELLSQIPKAISAHKTDKQKSESILEELLELARSQQRIIHNPEQLLPPSYLTSFLNTSAPRTSSNSVISRYLVRLKHLTRDLVAFADNRQSITEDDKLHLLRICRELTRQIERANHVLHANRDYLEIPKYLDPEPSLSMAEPDKV